MSGVGERWTLDPLTDTWVFPAPIAPLEVAGPQARSHGINLLELSAPAPDQKLGLVGPDAPIEGDDHFFDGRQLTFKLRVAEPPDAATTNLNPWPRADRGLMGWAQNAATGALTQDTSDVPPGYDYSFLEATPGTNATEGARTSSFPVTASQTYTAQVLVKAPAGATLAIGLNERAAADADVATTDATFTATGEWQTVTVTRAFGATGVLARVVVRVTGTLATTIRFTDGLVWQGTGGTRYFDGDSPGCSWTGTPGQSTSTRPGPGDRFQAILSGIERKVQKLTREGGSVQRVIPQGDAIFFDVQKARVDVPPDRAFGQWQRAEVSIVLDCRPFWRRAPQVLPDHVETTLPYLSFTEPTVGGAVPAVAKLKVDNDDTADQWTVIWGMRSWGYDPSVDAALFYEAEGRTLLGGSTAVVATGASGAGNNAVQSPLLAPSWLAVLGTQKTGGGNHLRHIGPYGVWARVQRAGNAGDVGIRLEWGEGDYRRVIRNDQVTVPDQQKAGEWLLVYLGDVNLSRAVTGAQRWEGRVVANSTVAGTDRVIIDHLYLVPAEKGGIASAVQALDVPTTFTARDEFNQAGGALAGKTLPIGGTWTGLVGTTGFTVDTATKTAYRQTTNTDAYGLASPSGATGLAGAIAQVDVLANQYVSDGQPLMGVFLRYVDANNYLGCTISPSKQNDDTYLYVFKMVAGTTTVLQQLRQRHKVKKRKRKKGKGAPVNANAWYTVRLMADASGRWVAWLFPQGTRGSEPVAAGRDTSLATGGALASGRAGLHDANGITTVVTRYYNNFFVAPLVPDMAAFAGRSLEVRYDRVQRQDGTGVLWTPVSSYEGDLLTIPPSQPEARTAELMVKMSRNDPDLLAPDSGIDDLSAQLTVARRGVNVPDYT